jgi:hypothetical protein
MDAARIADSMKLRFATDEQRRVYWLREKEVGKTRFIWRVGMLRFGLPLFLVFAILGATTPLNPISHPEAIPHYVLFVLFDLVMCCAFGTLWGMWMWWKH